MYVLFFFELITAREAPAVYVCPILTWVLGFILIFFIFFFVSDLDIALWRLSQHLED
jgi:hypothetical protein